MKQRRITLASGFIIACALTSMSFLFSSYQAKNLADDVWKMLGLSRQSGMEAVKNSFLNGYLHYYGVRNAKNIAVNDRAAVARDLLVYTKEYISGDEFKKQYETLRAGAKPQEPVLKPLRSIAQIQKDEINRTEQSIKDAEKTMKELKGDLAKGIQPVLDMLRQNLKDYQNPNHQMFSSIAMGEKYQQEYQIKTFHDDMKKWELDYPENINAFIAEKLEKMLSYTSDIDYNAELVEKNGKKKFVNPSYESKRSEWKQGFRAGRAVTEQAREFAEKWLSELK
jgi:hypothetical protein